MEREREERAQREKLQRERDALAADLYQSQQQLKSVTMDYELATEKADRLDKALEEMTGASKDDKEVKALVIRKWVIEGWGIKLYRCKYCRVDFLYFDVVGI